MNLLKFIFLYVYILLHSKYSWTPNLIWKASKVIHNNCNNLSYDSAIFLMDVGRQHNKDIEEVISMLR